MEAATTCASKESVSVTTETTKSEHSVVSYLSVLLCSYRHLSCGCIGAGLQRACTERLTRAFIVGQQSIDTAGDRA
jgi:hypothetical protein